MQLHCPNCKTVLEGAQINVPKNIAHCANCNHVCRISDAMAEENEDNSHKTNIVMPEGISVVPGLQLDIILQLRKISRLSTSYIFAIAFTLMPSLFLFTSSRTNEGFPLFALAILSVFLFIGLIMLLNSLVLTFNKTYVTVSSFELRIENSPFNLGPWKNKSFSRNEVDQLFVERYIESTTNNRPNYAYKLLLVLKDGKHIVLIKELKKAAYAFYIEHQIEKYMAIEDRRMDREFVPGQNRKMHFDIDKLPRFMQQLLKERL